MRTPLDPYVPGAVLDALDRTNLALHEAAAQNQSDRYVAAYRATSAVETNLRAAHAGAALGRLALTLDDGLPETLGAPIEAIEHLAMLGTVESIVTAVDVCADIVAILSGRQLGSLAKSFVVELAGAGLPPAG